MLSNMLIALTGYLPASIPGLPEPSLAVVSVTDRAIGLGNRRGNETRGGFTVVALKGGRLDVLVRFQLWGNQPLEVETAIANLRDRLLADQAILRSLGFLRMAIAETSLATFNTTLNAWSGTADYQILYEFRTEDTDGAESLIARIPVEIDSEYNESTVVTNGMVRWDEQTAATLEVRGWHRTGSPITALSILAFLPPAWNGNSVTLTIRQRDSLQEKVFSTLRDFFNAFALEPTTVSLGGQIYQGGQLSLPNADFPTPIILRGGQDFLQIRYADAALDQPAVVYLRVLK